MRSTFRRGLKYEKKQWTVSGFPQYYIPVSIDLPQIVRRPCYYRVGYVSRKKRRRVSNSRLLHTCDAFQTRFFKRRAARRPKLVRSRRCLPGETHGATRVTGHKRARCVTTHSRNTAARVCFSIEEKHRVINSLYCTHTTAVLMVYRFCGTRSFLSRPRLIIIVRGPAAKNGIPRTMRKTRG